MKRLIKYSTKPSSKLQRRDSRHWSLLLSLLFGLLISSALSAEQKQRFDDFDVHYSVVTSTFVSAEVARAYNIVRGKNRAFVMLAVRKLLPDGDRPQRALVSGSSSDLMRKEPLEFTEITEQDAIYYIAEFKFYNEELRNFYVKVQINANHEGYLLKFTKTLYIDD